MHQKRAQSTIRVQNPNSMVPAGANKRDKSTGNAMKQKTRANSKIQNALMNNNLMIGEAIGSGRNPRAAQTGINHNANQQQLLTMTQSEERVLSTTGPNQLSNYQTTQAAGGGVRRVKMR